MLKECWTSLESQRTQQHHQIGIWVQISQALVQYSFQNTHLWEVCPTVSLLNQALQQFHPFPGLYFNRRNDLHAQESHFQSGSHLCISESISSASAPHTQTIHLCNGHQRSSGFQCGSWWLLSRLLVSLAPEMPNQFNSCSCHSSHHQHQIFGLHWQTQTGTGNTPNWCSLSYHTAGRAAPGCPGPGLDRYHLPHKSPPVCATGVFTFPGAVLSQHEMPQWNFWNTGVAQVKSSS